MSKRSPHLMVRKNGVFCTICMCVEPVEPGNGTPLPTYIQALEMVRDRHPARKHANPFTKVSHDPS